MRLSPDTAPAALLELTHRLVAALVDRPEAVRITVTQGEKTVVLEIEAGRPEIGQIIGRGGRNFLALRDVVGAVGAKHGVVAQVLVLDQPEVDPSAGS